MAITSSVESYKLHIRLDGGTTAKGDQVYISQQLGQIDPEAADVTKMMAIGQAMNDVLDKSLIDVRTTVTSVLAQEA